MDSQQVLAIYETVRGALTGDMHFGQIVERLQEIGVTRYHADYSRQETTYYTASGDSVVVPVPHAPSPTGEAFSAQGVEAAVRQSQRGEHTYADFVRKTKAAGCIGYFVQISGRCAQYFGRTGEIHTERFPGAKDA